MFPCGVASLPVAPAVFDVWSTSLMVIGVELPPRNSGL